MTLKTPRHRFLSMLLLVGIAALLRFALTPLLEFHSIPIQLVAAGVILSIGALYVLRGAATIIEETTEVLSERTKLAGGLLQSLGTAFPDMVLGVMAALVSLRLRESDYALAINYAIIAAATTFGSNIYNIAHAAWCVFRQNLANRRGRSMLMFPTLRNAGTVLPMKEHLVQPSDAELETSSDILNALTILTATVAVTMVLFGKVVVLPPGFTGDLYQLIRPVGFVILLLSLAIAVHFRKTKRHESQMADVHTGEQYYKKQPMTTIWRDLALSGVAILFAAEAMVHAVQAFAAVTGMPYVVAGILAGLIGCMGEMLVIHNYTVNPKGRIGDALVGVGMDNIVTTMGAAIVAVMGGIFLGGSSLILIFVVILTLNTTLIWQIAKLKNSLLLETARSKH